MAASITPDPFVPSGHYRVRSPSQIRRDFGERNSSRRLLEGRGWHCASSNWDSLELNWTSILQAPSHCQKSSRSPRSGFRLPGPGISVARACQAVRVGRISLECSTTLVLEDVEWGCGGLVRDQKTPGGANNKPHQRPAPFHEHI
jgi:hypothetical protein